MAEDKSILDNNGIDDLIKPVSEGTTPSDQSQDLKETGEVTSSDEDIHNSDNSDQEGQDGISGTDNLSDEPEGEEIHDTTPDQKEEKTSNKSKFNIYKVIRIACIIGFVIFSALFINEVIIQPWRIKQSIDLTRQLYDKPTDAPTATPSPTLSPEVTVTAAPTPVAAAIPTPDPNRDSLGRLLQFKDLLAANADVKGWLTIPDTNVDYVVVQSTDNPELYLDKDINLEYSKAGTLFLDYHGSVENKSQNLVIHGHNMVSTAEKMFHYILKYKKVSYYKDHPLITFDSIYNTGKWKVFAVFITNGSSKKEPLFDYTKANFKNASDFLNFVYQLRIRSVLNIDSVDITDNDQLLMLSTCSYEVDNYRTVIVARKVRDGEDTNVDTSNVSVNDNPLYPESYYYRYGGKAPELPATFEDALSNGDIKWYTPPASNSGQ